MTIPCPDCDMPVYVPDDTTEEDVIECGNCGAVASGDWWLDLAAPEPDDGP